MPCVTWILILVFTLSVLINYSQCKLDPCFLKDTRSSTAETNLCLRYWINSREVNLTSPNTKDNDKVSTNSPYNEGDKLTLACISKPPFEKSDTVHWKLEQNDTELLITRPQNINISNNWYEIIISPDRNDHHLVAICEAGETKKIVKFMFSWNTINNDTEITEDNTLIEERNYTAGQTVQNTLDRHVVVYNNKKLIEKFVKPKGNIYDRLTEDKNQNLYSAWFEGHSKEEELGKKLILTLYKKYSRIIVLPNDELGENSFPMVAVVTGTISLLVIVVFAFCIYRKYVKRRQTCDNSEHIVPVQVTYAEINVKAANRPLPPTPQEPYATIIGVVKPKKKSTASETPRTRLHLQDNINSEQ